MNWPFLLQNLVAAGGPSLVPATSPTNSNQFKFVGLVAGTKFWSVRLDFVAKMASSHDATSPCDLLQGLVAGTSPIVCTDLKCPSQKKQIAPLVLLEFTVPNNTATGKLTHNYSERNTPNAHKSAQIRSENFKPSIYNVASFRKKNYKKVSFHVCLLAVLGSQGIIIRWIVD